MSVYSADEVLDAVRSTGVGQFPLQEGPATVVLLRNAIRPAMDGLPPHHDCAMVREALQTMFVMGLAAGIELKARGT